MKALWLWTGLLLVLGTAAAAEPPAKKPPARTYQIPYSLTVTKHIVVRAKINGNGPYHFLVDTGAPVLVVSARLCRILHIEADKNSWGIIDRFEIENGPIIKGFKARLEDLFQLEGMNGMGLAGVELHGVIGYQLLARYRLEFDLTRDRLTWTELDFTPPKPLGLGEAGGAPLELNALGTVLKLLGGLLGRKPGMAPQGRGFLGVQVFEKGGKLVVQRVLANSPAARGGLQAGDQIQLFQGKTVDNFADLHRLAATIKAKEAVKLTVGRNGQTHQLTLTSGEGL
jgi:hypothetical protein